MGRHGRPSAATTAHLDAVAATVAAHLSRWASPPLSTAPLVGIDAAARGTAVGFDVPPVRPPAHRPTRPGGPPLVGAAGEGPGPAAAAAAAAAVAAARHQRGSGETFTRHLALLVPGWTPTNAPALRAALWRALDCGGDASLTPAGTEAAAADPAAAADELTIDVGGVLVGIVVGGGSPRGVAGLLGGGGLTSARSTAAGGPSAWAAAARTCFMAAQGGLFPDMARLAKLWVESVAWPDEEEVTVAAGEGGARPPRLQSPPLVAKPSALLVELVMLAAYHDDAGEPTEGEEGAWDRNSVVDSAAGGTTAAAAAATMAAAAGPPCPPPLPPPDAPSPSPPPAGRWRALPLLGLGGRGGSPRGARASGGGGAEGRGEGRGEGSGAMGVPRRRRLARWRRATGRGRAKPASAWEVPTHPPDMVRLGWEPPEGGPFWSHLVYGGDDSGHRGPLGGDLLPQQPAAVAPSAESLAEFLGDDRVGGCALGRGGRGIGRGGDGAKGPAAPLGVRGARGVPGDDALAAATLAAVRSGRLAVATASEPPSPEATPVGLDRTCARIFIRFLKLLSGDATDAEVPGGGGSGDGVGGSSVRVIGWDALYAASVAMVTAPPVPAEGRPLMVLDPALPIVDVAAQVTDWEPLRAAARRTAATLLGGPPTARGGPKHVTTMTAAAAAATITYPTLDHRRGGLPWGIAPATGARGWHPESGRRATPPRDPSGIASLVSALQGVSPPAWCLALHGGSGGSERGGGGVATGVGGRDRDGGLGAGLFLGGSGSRINDGGASSLSDALPLPRVLSILSDGGPDADAAAAAVAVAAVTRGGGTRGAAGGLATSMAGDASPPHHHDHSPPAEAPPPPPPPGYAYPRVVIATAAVSATVAAAGSAEWTPVGGEVAFQGGGWRLWVRPTGGGGPPLPPLGTGSSPGRGGGGSGDGSSLLSRQSSSVRRRLRAAVGAVGGGGGVGGDIPAAGRVTGSPDSSSGGGGGGAAVLPTVTATDGGGVGGGGGGGTGGGGGGGSGGGRATKPVPYTFTRLDVAVERLGGDGSDGSGASGWLVMDARLAGVETATLAWGSGGSAQMLVGSVEIALPTVLEVVFSLL
ncbi:hypothetical protein MMPV_004004 [Pyropia vietnamensis]